MDTLVAPSSRTSEPGVCADTGERDSFDSRDDNSLAPLSWSLVRFELIACYTRNTGLRMTGSNTRQFRPKRL